MHSIGKIGGECNVHQNDESTGSPEMRCDFFRSFDDLSARCWFKRKPRYALLKINQDKSRLAGWE